MPQLHPAIHTLKFQRTFCMVKPDGVARGLIGDIIGRIERADLKVVAMKMVQPDKALAYKHYPMEDKVWVERLGVKALTAFDDLEVTAKDVFGTDDTKQLGQTIADGLAGYLMSGPVVCMVVEGTQAITMVRKLAGNTLPFKADVGTIRGDYSVDSPSIAVSEGRPVHNLFHASEHAEEARNEMLLWFGEDLSQAE